MINSDMATRTILSPGVEIRERDLSLIATQNVGTNVFIAGYSQQGPTDEVIKITTRGELDQVYGTPTNSAERYFYHGIRELLNSPAQIYTSRLPYGAGNGVGFGSEYSALVYPVKSVVSTTSTVASAYNITWNYADYFNAIPLSGAAFRIQTSNATPITVVYSIDGAGAARAGDVVVPVTSTSSVARTIYCTASALSAASVDRNLRFSVGATSLTVFLSAPQVAQTVTPATSASIIPGFDDTNDVFSLTPILSSYTVGAGVTNNLDIDQGTYVLGEPVQVMLTESQYLQLQDGSLFTWSNQGSSKADINGVADLGKAGLIIVNKAKTTINPAFEGFYVAVADNFNLNPATNYDSVLGAKTVSLSAPAIGNAVSYTDIPLGTFQFSLSSNYLTGPSNSISQIMENLTDYNIDGEEDDDLLNIGVFKLRKSLYATEAYKLDYVLDGAIVGSIDYYRTKPNQNGGPQTTFFLENVDSNDRNVEIMVNPYVSNRNDNTSIGIDGVPTKKVRVLTHNLVNNNDESRSGIPTSLMSTLASTLGYADNIYPVGTYAGGNISTKDLGSIPAKIERALDLVKNDEIYDIDVVVEAGLGTIHTVSTILNQTYYDETEYPTTLSTNLDYLRTSGPLSPQGEDVRSYYTTVFNKFENFCNLPSNTGGRGDCVFIADPIRQIMVVGKNLKYLTDKNKNFQRDIYWAMRHQFELENSSYATVYGNWAQIYDEFIGDRVWVPFSPVAATTFARSDAAEFPWSAPAGYNRGLVSGNVINIAITPNQKQRDELYKSNINPVLFSPSQGIAIFGQKTLSRVPSAFDRINVRRLFLALERPTKKASIFFVFEPNNEFTRTRFINTLAPLFEFAKANGGLYDYLIVCDERNNTPQVIDSNELRMDIYIKPTRTAEYVIVQFVATRTDANFEELIG